MPSIERFIAFRAFGDIQWPPVVDIAREAQPALGMIDIFYVWDAPGNRYAACVRWLARPCCVADATASPLYEGGLDQLKYVHQFKAGELAAAFAAERDGELVLRFDAWPDGDSTGERLRFDGIHVLEQYAAPDDGAPGHSPPQCQLRIPLLASYSYGADRAGRTLHSAIQIGQPDNPSLRLNLALALPAPLNEGQRKHGLGFMAFSALYAPVVPPSALGGTPLRFNTLTFGPPGADAPVSTSAHVLGGFTFASAGAASDAYAVCKEQVQWSATRTVLEGVLPGLGFRCAHKPRRDLVNDFQAQALAEGSGLIRMPSVALGRPTAAEGLSAGYALRQTFAIQTTDLSADAIDEAMSDVRVRDGKFQLRAPAGGQQWITLDKVIYIVLDIEGGVTDPWQAHVPVTLSKRIGWTEPLAALRQAAGPLLAAPAMADGASAVQLLAGAIAAMRLARIDLRHLSPEQPQSLLPDLELAPEFADEARHFGLFSRAGGVLLDAGGTLAPQASSAALRAGYRLSMQTADVLANPDAASGQLRIPLSARWPSFHQESDGKGGARKLALLHAPATFDARQTRPRTLEGAQDALVMLGIEEVADTRGTLQSGLGGMAFSQSGPRILAGAAEDNTLSFGARDAIGLGRNKPQMLAAGNLELRLLLAVHSAQPLGADVARGDRGGRAAPLLLREVAAEADTAEAGYLLNVSETIRASQAWRLKATLLEQKKGRADIKTVIFSEQPFSVQRLWSSPLESLGGDSSTTVAEYDSDKGVWNIKRDGRSYHYVLPPQSVGESMDKPRRLELRDADPGQLEAQGFLSPVPPDDSELYRYPVEFRLTPPAELWVEPSDVERAYFAPPWASAQIFRQSSQLGVGAALTAFRGEFLYGLPVSLQPRREGGPARRARVAEIEALTGRPLAADADAIDGVLNRWQRLLSVMARRPERLEIWADDPDSALPFAPARFTDSPVFCLRPGALHRPAVPGADLRRKDQDAPLWPRQRVDAVSPRLHPRGLAGGALWPIESNNVLNMVLEAPEANAGSIEQIALSPLGGDADQDVKFCKRRVSIISSTRGGFVQRQKVEVIGRIGVFWHRAKHVVIYERTVNPSPQFTPVGGLTKRTRRPVLRKVSEYIEILQPERRYPDMAAAPVRSCGFLRGMRFNSTIIPVDSAWAEDVGTTGWQIPLWNRHAASVRPQVYPRPDTAFVTAAEGPAASSETAQECLNPDNMYFFADTGDVDDRTDLWAERLGIDYTDLPPPCHNWPSSARSGAPVMEDAGSAASAPRVPSGFARFTWLLAPSSQRTAVNTGRGEQPVYTALESLTFMRAGGRAAPSAPSQAIHIAASLGQPAAPIFAGTWRRGATLDGPADAPLVAFSATLAQAGALLRSGFPDAAAAQELRALLTELGASGAGVTEAGGQLETRIRTARDQYAAALAPFGGALDSLERGAPNYCATMTNNVRASLGAKRLAMVQEVRAMETLLLKEIAAHPGQQLPNFSSEQLLRVWIEEKLSEFLVPVFSAAGMEVGKLRRGIETSRSAMADARAEIAASVKSNQARLQAVRSAMDLEKPWSAARLARFRSKLDDVFRRAHDGVASALQDARRRLASELDDLSQGVGTAASRAIGMVAAEQGEVEAWLGYEAGLAARLRAIDQQLAAHQAGSAALFADAHKALADAEARKPALAAAIAGIKQDIARLRTRLDATANPGLRLGAMLEEAGRGAVADEKVAIADLRELAGAAGSALQDMLDALDIRLAALEKPALEAVRATLGQLRLPLQQDVRDALDVLAGAGAWIDAVIAGASGLLASQALRCSALIDAAGADIDEVARHSLALVANAEAALAPEALVKAIISALLGKPTVAALIARTVADVLALQNSADQYASMGPACSALAGQFIALLEQPFGLDEAPLKQVKTALEEVCSMLGGGIGQVRQQLTGSAAEILSPLKVKLQEYQTAVLSGLDAALADARQYAGLVGKFEDFDRDVRVIGTGLASTAEKAQAYGERVIDAVGQIGSGGLAVAPGNIFKAFAAAGDSPWMPNLNLGKQRLGYYLAAVNDVVDITPVTACFGGLADGLASMCLNAPCDRIGNWLETMDLSGCDIGAVIDKFAGCELGKLVKGQKFDGAMNNAIRISHDFDEKSARGWVRIDVDAPMDGTHPLFSVGPFSLNMLDARLLGYVRLEGAADTGKVEQTGSASITTSFDAVVGGQSMVTLSNVGIRYDKSGSLKVDFDPKNIKLNPTFQFIQNTLQAIVGDDVGGLKIVKRDGIPVGVEHLFSMPPVSAMFGTSGVQNLQISNQFQLLAYPDFVIANRFSLARPNLPFIFSVFIIGGTGWLTVDCEYRPFSNALLVVVEAAAGGSASLGFSFAGCTGSVAITISVALNYRKLVGQPGGGLTVSSLVLIVGVVDVLCIANAQLSLLMRLSYRENGDIDASGTFSFTIRISYFLEVSAGGEARYAMHGGRSESSASSHSDYQVHTENVDKARKLINGQKGEADA